MINSKKKGFTIVELVIVIAVVAILAAVLIPTFSSLVKKANVSNDTALVKNLNTALAADVDGQDTMYDALQAAKEFGYDIAKIQAKANGNKILWDSKNDCFVYLDSEKGLVYIPDTKNENPADVDLWVISDEVDETYSTYLYGYEGENTITTAKGIDAGETKGIVSIKVTSTEEIIIRTNGGNLIVESGTINHYGNANYLTVEDSATYNEYGKVVANLEEVDDLTNEELAIYAKVNTSDELKAALLNGGKIVLCANIEIEDEITAETGFIYNVKKDTEINLNGYNITATRFLSHGSIANGVIKVSNNANLILSGYGVISLTQTGADMGYAQLSATLRIHDAGSITINDAVIVEHNGGTAMSYGVDVYGNNSLTINGGAIYSTYIGVREFFPTDSSKASININGGIISGGRVDVWFQVDNFELKPTDFIHISDKYSYTCSDVDTDNGFKGSVKYYLD